MGDYAPLDVADACGMNLLDIHTCAWVPALLAAASGGGSDAAAALEAKLGGSPVPSHTVVGRVAPYFCARYGMSPHAAVVAWSGDNPCTVAGLRLRAEAGDVALSLGTSDTLFGVTHDPAPGRQGHVFVNPVDCPPPGSSGRGHSYMTMLCYKNGAAARRAARDAAPRDEGTWARFSDAIRAKPVGNGGTLVCVYPHPEVTPHVVCTGMWRFPSAGLPRPAPAPLTSLRMDDARGVVEWQQLAARRHAEALGLGTPSRVLATGGGSANAAVLQIAADVWAAPVFTAATSDGACVGAALRARHGARVAARGCWVPFDYDADGDALHLAAVPSASAHATYAALMPAAAAAEAAVVASTGTGIATTT